MAKLTKSDFNNVKNELKNRSGYYLELDPESRRYFTKALNDYSELNRINAEVKKKFEENI